MASKIFEVGDILPATTQLQITFIVNEHNLGEIKSNNNNLIIVKWNFDASYYIKILGEDKTHGGLNSENTYIIDTSNWSLAERTISYANANTNVFTGEPGLLWEDLAPTPSGYTITFNSNGGSTATDLTEQTALPNPLPTTTKANHVFAGWYLDSSFTQKAVAGATIESNVTLYAKWYTPTTWCEDIADAIREKEGSSGNIKHVDFPDKIRALEGAKPEETKTVTPNFSSGNQIILPTTNKVLSQVTLTKPTDLIPENIAKDKNVCGVVGTLEGGGGGGPSIIELTQIEYDALETKDEDTYYLIKAVI